MKEIKKELKLSKVSNQTMQTVKAGHDCECGSCSIGEPPGDGTAVTGLMQEVHASTWAFNHY